MKFSVSIYKIPQGAQPGLQHQLYTLIPLKLLQTITLTLPTLTQINQKNNYVQ